MTPGKRIKQKRTEKGLSQEALADLCGWESRTRISNYEHGISEPKLADFKRLAKALKVKAAWLAFGDE